MSFFFGTEWKFSKKTGEFVRFFQTSKRKKAVLFFVNDSLWLCFKIFGGGDFFASWVLSKRPKPSFWTMELKLALDFYIRRG